MNKFYPYLALEASAGTGKTFALALRYIALVLQGKNVGEILAMTFTNKAANEMKERIIDTFINLEKRSSELKGVADLLLVDEKQALILRDERREHFLRSELKILTFDSFFSIILRLFSLNVGLMPDFKGGINIDEICKNEFIFTLEQAGLLKRMADYIFHTKDNKDMIFSMLRSLYENGDDVLNDSLQNYKFPKKEQEKVFDIYGEFKNYVFSNYDNANLLKNFQKTGIDEICASNLVADINKNYFTKPMQDSKFIDFRYELLESLRSYYCGLEKFKLGELCCFFRIYQQTRTKIIKQKNCLDFADITKFTYDLLTKNIDKDMLYFRLDSKITHILLDEFQDTNILQYRILLPLISEIISGIGQNGMGSFFYVGDIKQSIYRFRGGKKELFKRLSDEFSQIKKDSLEVNFRSSKSIVEFVNSVFSRFDGMIAGYYMKQKFNENANTGYVEVSEFIHNKNESNFLEQIINKTKFLLDNGVQDSDIAILCWKNSDIGLIKDTLQNNSIKVASSDANLLINNAKVRLVIEYMKACILGDNIYFYEADILTNTTNSGLNLNINDVVGSIKYAAKNLKINCFDKNLLKLYELSAKYENIFDFIFNIENEQALSVNAGHDGVTIMTVHKSKGLGFHSVIVVDKIGKSGIDNDRFIIEYNMQTSKWEVRLKNKAFEVLGDDEYINLVSKVKNLDKDDDINKIYVALTRAKENLIILKNSTPNGVFPSYFTAFDVSKQIVEFLDLTPVRIGLLQPSKIAIKNTVKSNKLNEFIKINKQNINAVNKDTDEFNMQNIFFGNALHYGLEMLGEFKKECLDNAFYAIYNKFGWILSDEIINEIKIRIMHLINNKYFTGLIDGKMLLKEQDIAFNGVLNRFDLLCVTDDEITVFDYKSSKKFIDKNISQVQNYMNILKEIYPDKKVYGKIIFLLHEGCEIQNIDDSSNLKLT